MADVQLDLRRDPVATRASGEKLLTLGREAGNLIWQEFALNYLAWASLELGELSRAESELAQNLAVAREAGLKIRVAHVQILLGDVARLRGQDALARASYQESRESRAMSEGDYLPWLLRCQGLLAVHRGDLGEAESLFRASLTMVRTLPNTLDQIECLNAFASLFATRGEGVRAACLLGAVVAALRVVGLKLYFGDRFERARTLDALHASLSEVDFAAASAEGQAMTLEQAIVYALSDVSSDS